MRTENYLPQFQGLRAIAFTAIFISHLTGLGAPGAWGVSVFFTLSGFLMVYRHWSQETIPLSGSRFSYQKIHRLYLLHIAAMLICVVRETYFCLRHSASVTQLMIKIALNTTLTQAWIPSYSYYFSLNGVAWYLSVCTFLYFCFPFVLKGMRRLKSGLQAHIMILSLFVLQISVSFFAFFVGGQAPGDLLSVHWITYVCPLTRSIDFCIGCFLGYLYLHHKKTANNKTLLSLAEIGVCILIVLSWFIYTNGTSMLGSEPVRYTLLFTPTTAVLIWLIAKGHGCLPKLLSADLLIKIGNVSPAAFLIHQVVIIYLKQILNKVHLLNLCTLSFTSILLTFAAVKVWLAIEKRIALRKDRH